MQWQTLFPSIWHRTRNRLPQIHGSRYEERHVEAVLLGQTKVVYEMEETKDYFPGTYNVVSQELLYKDGSIFKTTNSVLAGTMAEDIRSGKITQIKITLS